MATEVTMPKLGLTMTEGLLDRWLVPDGTQVKKGQPIFEVATDKATMEVAAAADGRLRIVIPDGSTVPVTGVVAYIAAAGEELPTVAAGNQPAGSPASAPAPEPAAQTTSAVAQTTAPGTKQRLASPAAKRRGKELGVDLALVEGSGEDGYVNVADVEKYAENQARAATASPVTEVLASPLAKKLAQEAGVDLATVKGTGERGRITREDVEQIIASRQPQPTPIKAATPAVAGTPIQGVRAIIAERMQSSSRETAAVTLTCQVDATDLVEMRKRLNEGLAGSTDSNISYNDILIKMAAQALREHPYMNARQEGNTIVHLQEVNVGLAVDSERGLLVPVVPNADRLSLPEISQERREKVNRALAGQSRPDDFAGGTFTITNLGSFDIDAFTPIINPPQLAILGVGRIAERPAAYRGELRLRQQMVLSLTFDHRLVDGGPAARFLQRIKGLVENPYLLLTYTQAK